MAEKEKRLYWPVVHKWLIDNGIPFKENTINTVVLSMLANEKLDIYYRSNNGQGELRLCVQDGGILHGIYKEGCKKRIIVPREPKYDNRQFCFYISLKDHSKVLPLFVVNRNEKPIRREIRFFDLCKIPDGFGEELSPVAIAFLKGISVQGKGSWRQLYLECLELLYQSYPDRINRLVDKELKRKPILMRITNPALLNTQKGDAREIAPGIWVNVGHFAAKRYLDDLRLVLESIKIAPSKVLVLYSPDEPESKKNSTINNPTELIRSVDSKEITGYERDALVKVRINQSKFRELLLQRYECKCALCGVEQPKLLIASHIKPWRDSNNKEKTDIWNGFIFCPNHDRLFDQGYISFDDKGRILISSELTEQTMCFMNVNPEMHINVAEEGKSYLQWHRAKVFKE